MKDGTDLQDWGMVSQSFSTTAGRSAQTISGTPDAFFLLTDTQVVARSLTMASSQTDLGDMDTCSADSAAFLVEHLDLKNAIIGHSTAAAGRWPAMSLSTGGSRVAGCIDRLILPVMVVGLKPRAACRSSSSMAFAPA